MSAPRILALLLGSILLAVVIGSALGAALRSPEAGHLLYKVAAVGLFAFGYAVAGRSKP